jgi:hypothetical protein
MAKGQDVGKSVWVLRRIGLLSLGAAMYKLNSRDVKTYDESHYNVTFCSISLRSGQDLSGQVRFRSGLTAKFNDPNLNLSGQVLGAQIS